MLFQIFRRSTFHYLTVFQYDYVIGIDHGSHPVGDNQYCFIPYEFGYPGLNLGFVFHVEGGGGLVKQDDRGVFQQGAGDRDTLAFSTG